MEGEKETEEGGAEREEDKAAADVRRVKYKCEEEVRVLPQFGDCGFIQYVS